MRKQSRTCLINCLKIRTIMHVKIYIKNIKINSVSITFKDTHGFYGGSGVNNGHTNPK